MKKRVMHLKVDKIKKNIVLVRPNSLQHQTNDFIDELRCLISKEKCQNMILDLTGFNLLDCIKIGALAATYHFLEILNGKVYLVVDSKEAQQSIEILNFCNAEVIYNEDSLDLENIA